jgi:hypothetical protein
MSKHDLFSHVRLPKHKIPMNVFVQEIANDDRRTCNFIREMRKVGIGLERISTMRSDYITFSQGKGLIKSHGENPNYTEGVGILRKLGEVG